MHAMLNKRWWSCSLYSQCLILFRFTELCHFTAWYICA